MAYCRMFLQSAIKFSLKEKFKKGWRTKTKYILWAGYEKPKRSSCKYGWSNEKDQREIQREWWGFAVRIELFKWMRCKFFRYKTNIFLKCGFDTIVIHHPYFNYALSILYANRCLVLKYSKMQFEKDIGLIKIVDEIVILRMLLPSSFPQTNIFRFSRC